MSPSLYRDKPQVNSKAKASLARPDYKNVITWAYISEPGVVAVSNIWCRTTTGEIVDADMVFNTAYKWGIGTNDGETPDLVSRFDIQNVATHEAGHWTGLDDIYDSIYKTMTMYGYTSYGQETQRSLEPGDIAGAQVVYP